MKQIRLGLNVSAKQIRKREFRAEMDCAVPWDVVVQSAAPCCAKAKIERPAFAIDFPSRHHLRQCFGLSDPAMREALLGVSVHREFAKLDGAVDRLPDETTFLRFRRLLEKNNLAPGCFAWSTICSPAKVGGSRPAQR